MIKILFVTLGHLSAGEFTIAFEFCKGLPKEEFDVCFLTSTKGTSYLKESKIRYVVLEQSDSISNLEDKSRNKKITDDVMKQFRPDYVIASDVYTLWYSHTWTGLNLEIFKEYGVPIGSFDSYEFSSTDFVQDYYGGYKATIPDYINQCDFVIRYCPINKIQKTESNVKLTYLFGEKLELTMDQKLEFKRTFNPNQEKVIFITSSNWESLNVNRLPALTNLMDWVPRILIHYISQLNEKLTIIHVGPHSYKSLIPYENISYFHYPFIRPEIFDTFLAGSDLFLTTNIISSTLAKAIYATVPAIVLQNDKLVNYNNLKEQLRRMPDWYQEMARDVKIAYPFRLFPFGWYSFLKPLFHNNEYTDTFLQSILFQNAKTVNLLRSYLYDENLCSALKQKQSIYVDKVIRLPSPKNVIESLVE